MPWWLGVGWQWCDERECGIFGDLQGPWHMGTPCPLPLFQPLLLLLPLASASTFSRWWAPLTPQPLRTNLPHSVPVEQLGGIRASSALRDLSRVSQTPITWLDLRGYLPHPQGRKGPSPLPRAGGTPLKFSHFKELS